MISITMIMKGNPCAILQPGVLLRLLFLGGNTGGIIHEYDLRPASSLKRI